MYEVKKIFDQLIDQCPEFRKLMLDDAKTMKTYGKAKNYAKEFKYEFDSSYNASAEEQIMSAFNTLIDDTIQKLNQEANNAEIKK